MPSHNVYILDISTSLVSPTTCTFKEKMRNPYVFYSGAVTLLAYLVYGSSIHGVLLKAHSIYILYFF
jgi:hypothetical protein